MRIDRLTVKNFKGFVDREFNFHPQMNLLVGLNGSGKTSVLDALAVAAGSWFLGLKGCKLRPIKGKEVRLQAIHSSNGRHTNGHSGAINWEYQYPALIEASGVVLDRELSWTRAVNTKDGGTTFVGAKGIKQIGIEADLAVRSGAQVVLPLVSYYGTGRLWDTPNEKSGNPAIPDADQMSRLSGYHNSIDPRVSVSDLIRWIVNQSWVTFQQGLRSIAYEAARTAMLGCIEDAKDIDYDAKRQEVIVEIGNQGKQPFGNLSDGQRCLLAMVGDLAQKAITLNPALENRALAETPGVVLIDELDLHLHPTWQRSVLENLRMTFPKIQFFATTHSPFLIQSLRSGEELQMLDGEPTAQLGNKTVDEIALGIMGVPSTLGARYQEMKDTATNYLQALDAAAKTPPEKLADFQERLSKSVAPYADNPAYQAFLEMKRAAKLGS